ncbi:MAG: hypothetical protein M0Z49_04300 [Chloroflexi bacterium]|nr:hypothetical protein [Chloroflexota bacterium]
MEQLHRTLAYAVVAGVLAAVVWTAAALVTGRGGGERLHSFQNAVVGLVALAAIVGLVLFVTGHSPHDQIHLLYGFLALAALPFARSFGPRLSDRGRIGLGLAGTVAIGLFVLRLFMTG